MRLQSNKNKNDKAGEWAVFKITVFLLLIPTAFLWLIFPYTFPLMLDNYNPSANYNDSISQFGYSMILLFPFIGLVSCALISHVVTKVYEERITSVFMATILTTIVMVMTLIVGLSLHVKSISWIW